MSGVDGRIILALVLCVSATKPLAKDKINSGSTQNTHSDLSPYIDRTQISNETFSIQLETFLLENLCSPRNPNCVIF